MSRIASGDKRSPQFATWAVEVDNDVQLHQVLAQVYFPGFELNKDNTSVPTEMELLERMMRDAGL